MLTDDFVIGVGVGVGAVVFALARQVVKVWGHKDESEAVTTNERDREPVEGGRWTSTRSPVCAGATFMTDKVIEATDESGGDAHAV